MIKLQLKTSNKALLFVETLLIVFPLQLSKHLTRKTANIYYYKAKLLTALVTIRLQSLQTKLTVRRAGGQLHEQITVDREIFVEENFS